MAITNVTNKNAGAEIINAGNGNSGAADFDRQLQELRRINNEATERSLKLRQEYTLMNSVKKVADERVN